MKDEEKNITTLNNNSESKNIISFEEDGFTIVFSNYQLSVLVNLLPSKYENKSISFSKIKNELIVAGIKTEINEELLKNSVDKVNAERCKIEGLVVSSGYDSIQGKDGWFELTCSKKGNNELKKQLDTKFDEIISLKKDDLIGIIHLPENGKDGVDVFGKIIPAEHGKEKEIKFGENVYTKEKIVISIFASIDGFLEIKNNQISITETLKLYGDVDFRTGDIIGFGSLKVLGSVLNGSFLNLKNLIEIGGYVGDAEIVSGNDIKILGGFLGTGKGVIKSGGNLDVKFIQDQNAYSRGSLNFIREIVHSKIFVKENITGKGSHASIIGGYTLAGKSVEIYSAGNDYGIATVIEVGYDYEMKDVLIKNRLKLNELNKLLKKLNKEILEFSRMKRLNDSMFVKMKLLADKHKELAEEISKLNDENREIIQTVRRPSDSFVKISNAVYPGTKIIINRKNFLVKEKLLSKTFKLNEENEIILV